MRIGKKKDTGELIVNPTYLERVHGELEYEVLACGKDGTINMIETGGNEVDEADIVTALTKASEIHKEMEAFQKEMVKKVGLTKRAAEKPEVPADMQELFDAEIAPKLKAAVFSGTPGKKSIYELKSFWKSALKEKLPEAPTNIASDLFEEAIDVELHRGALEEEMRADGRDLDTVRPLYAQAGNVSDVLHGVGVFYRGGTHILSALTLGGPQDSQNHR